MAGTYRPPDPIAGQSPLVPPEGIVAPGDDVWIALDVETTGLSPDEDDLIEIGAVKFQGRTTIDTFQSFVNPDRTLSGFITRYTGIAQRDVDGAPRFSAVALQLARFLGTTPLVGHNIGFDLGFLASSGLRLSNPVSDTWDLAYVLLPEHREYGLSRLAAHLGEEHSGPHRAVADAEATSRVFLKLMKRASELDPFTLAEMERMASRSSWVLAHLLRRLEVAGAAVGSAGDGARQRALSTVSPMGFDIGVLRERLKHARALRSNRVVAAVDADRVASFLATGGPVARTLPGFEERAEQVSMARAVTGAFNGGKRLIVEAGTGVGKSLAYLLPAVKYALRNNKRVVVSTNTINLQEQLLTKDVPAVVRALEEDEPGSAADFRFTQLKGRANYLCLKRWVHMRSGELLSDDEARLLSKALVWLGSTTTGDRGELNLSNRKAASPWERLSAQGARDCNGVNGVCFLRAARDRAAAAHLVIVNHALLMSDLVAGRALIPDYDVLIVDEAQHLEEEATRHLGFEVAHRGLDDHLQALGGDRGLVNRAVTALRGSSAAATRRTTVEEVAGRIAGLVPAIRDRVAGMFAVLGGFVGQPDGRGSGFETALRVTAATRSQPAWSDLEVQWENVDVSLAHLQSELSALTTSLEGLEQAGLVDYDGLMLEVSGAIQVNADLRERLREFIPQPEPDGIYWLVHSQRLGELTLHKAPLQVGEQLEKLLYSQKASVVLTGATLSANGSFDHLRERTGFQEAGELLLGSPFDYPRSALLCVPRDMPEPSSWSYQSAVERAIVESARAVGGRTMALFTSYTALRAASSAIRGSLQSDGIDVLAQGIDGTPHQLVRTFMANPRAVLLGTSSFWEGVDLAGDALQVLLVARLPFSVPTEPVFTARSELYDDAFNEYAVPQAILRLRQGFGRLIRTKTDRGVVVILDRRTTSRRYGKAFVDSLPPVTLDACRLDDLPQRIRDWLR